MTRSLTAPQLLTTSWGGAAPATWNRHLATLGSFTAYAVRRRWLEADPATGLQRRKEIIDRTRSIDPTVLQRLFGLPGTWTTSGPGSAPRAARSSTCSGRPVPPGSCPA